MHAGRRILAPSRCRAVYRPRLPARVGRLYDDAMLEDVRVLMFDWGGTIVHVARQLEAREACIDAALSFLQIAGLGRDHHALDDLRRRFLQSFDDAERLDALREFDTAGFLRRWAADHQLPLRDETLVADFADALWRPWIGCLDLIGDAKGTLRRLQAHGYVIGLVSNVAAPPYICLEELRREGVLSCLSFTVFSSEVGDRKPHVRIYDEALRQARTHVPTCTPPQALFIGDTPEPDIDGPSRLGFRTALVRTGRWDGSADVLKCQPDVILDSIDALPALLPPASR